MAELLVTHELRGAVGVVSLNRPEVHNAITTELRYALRDALAWAENEPQVGCVLLRGNGRSFCSGRDLRELGVRAEGQSHTEGIGIAQAVRIAQWEMRKPVLAALQGHVIGAGVELALAQDFRIAAENTVLRLPEIDYGLVVDTGATVFATALAGPSRAKWLIMSGEGIDARLALAWGLVDWVVPVAELEAKAQELAARLAAKPAQAVRDAKALVNDLLDAQVRSGMKRELATQSLLFETADYKRLREERQAARARRAAGKPQS
jgi:enoyl-CoA hydratase/carnithine racemase